MKKPSRITPLAACSIGVALLGFLFIRNLIDFPVYYAAGQSLLSGRTDLFAPDFALGRVMDYRYPPFFLIALTPLWLVPYSTAAYVWFVLSCLEIIGCVLIVNQTFPELLVSKKMWLLAALATIQYFVMALHYGNAHLLATFLLFASLYFFCRGRDVAAGLMMALAITIKLTPIVLLPYLAIKRKWKLMAAAGVFLIAINLAPSAYFGFRGNNDLLVGWYRHVVASQEFHEDNGPINLSLKGQLRRYLSAVDYSERIDGDVRYPSINLASLPRQQVDLVWFVGAALLFAVVLFLISPPGKAESREGARQNNSDRGGLVAHELALMLCLTLFLGPLTSKIYFVALLWPVACLARIALDGVSCEGRVAMRVLAVVALTNVVLPVLPGRSVQRLLLVLGVDFFVNCLLMAALAYSLVLRRQALRGRPVAPQMQVPSEAKRP